MFSFPFQPATTRKKFYPKFSRMLSSFQMHKLVHLFTDSKFKISLSSCTVSSSHYPNPCSRGVSRSFLTIFSLIFYTVYEHRIAIFVSILFCFRYVFPVVKYRELIHRYSVIFMHVYLLRYMFLWWAALEQIGNHSFYYVSPSDSHTKIKKRLSHFFHFLELLTIQPMNLKR